MGRYERSLTFVGNYFFDRTEVKALVRLANKRQLGWIAGYIARIAKNSIRRMGVARPAPRSARGLKRWWQEVNERPASPAGTPPYTHSNFLREDIVYSFDPVTESAVIGPWRIPWLNTLHERGGTVVMNVYRKISNGVTALFHEGPLATTKWERQGSTAATYPPRPFMAPALRKFASHDATARAWANSVRTN